MARIFKRKDRKEYNSWYLDYTVNGKRIRKKAGPSRQACCRSAVVRSECRSFRHSPEFPAAYLSTL